VVCSFAPPVVLLPIEVGDVLVDPSLHQSPINVDIMRDLPTSPYILLWLWRDVKIRSDMSKPFPFHTSADGQLIPPKS
jgi:hypothetical protein